MNQLLIQQILLRLKEKGVVLEDGLSDKEISDTENRFGFRFPPDLRCLLQSALPVSERFPNWRNADNRLAEMLSWPFVSMCFDIEHNKFWLPEWGTRPGLLAEAVAVAKEQFSRAPKLIPIYSHRYIPDEPRQEGNPVFSVYQTDIICYGCDLESYFSNEFKYAKPNEIVRGPRVIRFWSDLCS